MISKQNNGNNVDVNVDLENDSKLSFKLPVSMKNKLVAMSKERDIPISSIIRSLIREELKKYELGKEKKR